MKGLWTLVGNKTSTKTSNRALPSKRISACVVGIMLWLTASALLPSCISLKSEYPATSHYRLTLKPLTSKPSSQATHTVLIKTMAIDGELDTEHLLALVGTTGVQKYQYHRWISDPRELVTAYVANRLQATQAFTGGVYTESTTLLPTIELEGRIIDFTGKNAAPPAAGNTATAALHITVRQYSETTATRTVLLQKVYTQTIARPNDTAATIPEALSDALAGIVDAVLADILAALK